VRLVVSKSLFRSVQPWDEYLRFYSKTSSAWSTRAAARSQVFSAVVSGQAVIRASTGPFDVGIGIQDRRTGQIVPGVVPAGRGAVDRVAAGYLVAVAVLELMGTKGTLPILP